MEFLASNWGMLLAVAVLLALAGTVSQMRMMRRRSEVNPLKTMLKTGDPFAAMGQMRRPIFPMILTTLGGVVGLLAFIGVVLAIINYVKTT